MIFLVVKVKNFLIDLKVNFYSEELFDGEKWIRFMWY